MLPLRRSALCICFRRRFFAALEGPVLAVPIACVALREVIPTILAEINGERVRFIAIKFTPLVELDVGTETAPDLANRPACPVGLRCNE